MSGRSLGRGCWASVWGWGVIVSRCRGGVKTTAKVAVLFSFGPAPVRVDAQGNWVFTIRPITKVAA